MRTKNAFLIKFQYKVIWISLILTFNAVNTFAQGAWNMAYIPIDSLTNSYIGKQIRIDFKSSESDTVTGKIIIRHLLSKKDHVDLAVNNTTIRFTENWAFYDDHGLLRKQTLESIKPNSIEKIIIKDMILESINDSTITVLVDRYYSNKKSTNNALNKDQIQEKIIVNKNNIKGILYNIYE